METTKIKQADVKKNWVLVDADGKVLGRLATEIARVLRGKNKPTFTPNIDCGDNVVVINADKIKLAGNKSKTKMYYRHSNYIGGIKAITAEEMLASHPDRLIRLAVKGMMRHNALNHNVIKNLKIYSGTEHPHTAQQPVALAPRTAGIPNKF